MTHLRIQTEATPLVVDLSSLVPQSRLTREQFYTFCRQNRDLRIERNANGEIMVMPPAFSDTGNRNFKVALQLGRWAEQEGSGEGFDSSAGFTLPNGATRSPDAAWIRAERWHALTPEQQASFAPICPDFVVELRSASDSLTGLKEKLQEYIDNGTQLGLLIDRQGRTVHVYRPGRSPEILSDPERVSCEPELPGFTLRMAQIW
ncbi:MAG: Uma2 family endonuclease [Leptolyngbyaceae cyanobacterium SM2_5_2]|nr:Uma2 family endonuclease [Leptolyngbyaceae cyanobacterium SM2_5_2]